MTPTKRITDPTFVYVSADNTNLRAAFERIRHEQRMREETRKALLNNVPESWNRPLRKTS